MTDIVVTYMYDNAAVVMMLIVPLLTMRLVSEERRSRTLTLLFSAPVSMTEIVLGKYLGIMVFLLAMTGIRRGSWLRFGRATSTWPARRSRSAPPRRWSVASR